MGAKSKVLVNYKILEQIATSKTKLKDWFKRDSNLKIALKVVQIKLQECIAVKKK
jgi:hypothetical protein